MPSSDPSSSRRPLLLAASFICSCFNMLVSGSLDVFALYAPSFTTRLGYSQTETSAIAIIGNIGLYGVGPVSGHMADKLGPRPTSFIAGCLLALGYGLLSAGYANGLDSVHHNQPPTPFLFMALYLFLAGMGNSASYMAAFTSLAKNFTHARGLALSIPTSFFGLSAAALTLIAHSFFVIKVRSHLHILEDKQELDTANFLLFLGLLGGLVNAIAFVSMRILPAPNPNTASNVLDDHTIEPSILQGAAAMVRDENEETPLLREGSITPTIANASSVDSQYSTAPTRHPHHHPRSISGKAFFLDRDAQLFFLVMVCLTGTGLMIINSITAMVDAVAASENADLPATFIGRLGDKSPISAIHAVHVGLISCSSYVSRILAGFGSDVAIRRYGTHRINVVPIAAACMALAQVVGMFASLRWLYLCSLLTGLGYGGFFGVAGIIVAEFWGEGTCGQNWGWLSWGSALGGLLFNLLFGLVMDAARPVVDGEPQACKGHRCFRWALVASFLACVFSCGISIIMCIRQKRGGALRMT
ncbi:major facilitator superfamily domain-containing protein [Gamsiella multidivaricata]|uniref:major facilitator superfamily domain-containing protein n=1 Tax=Gamsiella multidivaricata TaxID=101098 RepID=UPI00221EBD52|nr:major facilitator superfamily domain-containing protein [Gamsiella multidivaricata]KAI7822055.1 major facilitator superfamily domain-containing protein [Gamsiella multidivaricata]